MIKVKIIQINELFKNQFANEVTLCPCHPVAHQESTASLQSSTFISPLNED